MAETAREGFEYWQDLALSNQRELDQLRQRAIQAEERADRYACDNNELRAKLALAEQRLDWLADEIRLVDLWHAVYPHTPTTPAALREAIDAAIASQGEATT